MTGLLLYKLGVEDAWQARDCSYSEKVSMAGTETVEEDVTQDYDRAWLPAEACAAQERVIRLINSQ